MVSLEEGTRNQLWAATAPAGVENGAFYEAVGVLGRHDKVNKDETLAGELWEWTEKELEAYKVE